MTDKKLILCKFERGYFSSKIKIGGKVEAIYKMPIVTITGKSFTGCLSCRHKNCFQLYIRLVFFFKVKNVHEFNFFLGRFNAIFFTRVEKLQCVPLRP